MKGLLIYLSIHYILLYSILKCFIKFDIFREKAERKNDPNVEYIDVEDFQ